MKKIAAKICLSKETINDKKIKLGTFLNNLILKTVQDESKSKGRELLDEQYIEVTVEFKTKKIDKK